MTGIQIGVGWVMIACLFGLFMNALRVKARLDVHLGRLDSELEQGRAIDTRVYKLESKLIEMTRLTQERLSGLDTAIENLKGRIDKAKELFGSLHGDVRKIQDDLDGKASPDGYPKWMIGTNTLIARTSERLDKLEATFTSFDGVSDGIATRVDALYATHGIRLDRLEDAHAKDHAENVPEQVDRLTIVINAICQRLDTMQAKLDSWPPEIRSEIAEAYRRMADAVEQVEIAETPLYEA